MLRVGLVFLGSGIGGVLRYLFGGWAQRTFQASFPFGTVGVNVIGSFLIVVIMALGLEKGAISAETRIFLTTGVMGGLTTYSTFNYETARFFEERAYGLGLLNVGVTLASCWIAAALGLMVARWLT
jgi:CrcB protein